MKGKNARKIVQAIVCSKLLDDMVVNDLSCHATTHALSGFSSSKRHSKELRFDRA